MNRDSEKRINRLLENMGVRVRDTRKRLYEEEETALDRLNKYARENPRQWDYTRNGGINLYRKGISSNSLKELKLPKEVEWFNCAGNNLTSLEGSPQIITDSYNCSDNNLRSLKGGPKEVGGRFVCSNNKLESLEGAPKHVGENFVCSRNAVKFTEEDVRAVCDVDGKIIV